MLECSCPNSLSLMPRARWNDWRAEVRSPCARRVSPRNFQRSAVLEWSFSFTVSVWYQMYVGLTVKSWHQVAVWDLCFPEWMVTINCASVLFSKHFDSDAEAHAGMSEELKSSFANCAFPINTRNCQLCLNNFLQTAWVWYQVHFGMTKELMRSRVVHFVRSLLRN